MNNSLFVCYCCIDIKEWRLARKYLDDDMKNINLNRLYISSTEGTIPNQRVVKRNFLSRAVVLLQDQDTVRFLLEYGIDVRTLVAPEYIQFLTTMTGITEEEAWSSGFRHSLHPAVLSLIEDVGDYLPVIGYNHVDYETLAHVDR
jgi:hypothetical protein